jgi:hypothetical protein
VIDVGQILAHVGMWLPLTVALCVIAVWAIRHRRPL